MHLNVSYKPYLKTEKWWQRRKKYLDIIKNSQTWWQYIFLTLTTGPDIFSDLSVLFHLPSTCMTWVYLQIFKSKNTCIVKLKGIVKYTMLFHFSISSGKQRLSSLNEMLWSVSFVKSKHGLCRMYYSIKLILVSLGLNKQTKNSSTPKQ